MNTIPFTDSTQIQDDLLYLNREGELRLDQGSSLIGRAIATFVEGRNYDLCAVIPALLTLNRAELGSKFSENQKYLYTKLAKKCGISGEDLEAIRLIGDLSLVDGNNRASLSTFLEKVEGNLVFNNGLRKLLETGVTTESVSRKALTDLSLFAFKTRNKALFLKRYEKIEKIDRDRTNLTDEEKISIQEMKYLEWMARLGPFIQQLTQKGVATTDLCDKIVTTHTVLENLKATADEEQRHQPGTIISYDSHNMWDHRGFSRCRRIFSMIAATILRQKSEHLSLGVREEGRNMEAHVWEKYRYEYQPLSSRVFNSYKVNMESLAVGEETKAALHALYGANWVQQLERRYQEIAIEYYKNPPQEVLELTNPHSRKIDAFFFTPRFTLPDDWHEKMKFTGKRAICSEFAVKALLQTLDRLNQRIAEDWDDREGDAPELTPPVRSYRRIEKITPSAAMTRLWYMRALEEVRPPEVIQQVMRFEPYTMHVTALDRFINNPLFVIAAAASAIGCSLMFWNWKKKEEEKKKAEEL